MPTSWTDRSHVWHTYAYLSGNGHELKIKPLIPEGHGGLGGHQLINLGKLPNHWTDRDQIWHTYTDFIVVCGSVTAELCDASSVLAKQVVRSACMKHSCFQL